MDLEIRIDALEAEVKVLKNEIQNILLEIQEQLLEHYYPSLRVEDAEPSDTLLRALEGIREKKETRASETEAAERIDDIDNTLPKVKPASLESLRRDRALGKATLPVEMPSSGHHPATTSPPRAKRLPLFADAPPLQAGGEETTQEDEWQAFSEMLTWVQNNIGTMGEDRIHSVIELYRQEGFVSARVAKALERSIALFA